MQNSMTVNADKGSLFLAGTLSELGNQGHGTLVLAEIRKKGVLRGTGAQRKPYGNDLVHVLIWAGFDYKALVERSHQKLHALWGQGTLFGDLQREVTTKGYPVEIEVVSAAVQEVEESLLRVIRGADSPFDEEEPLPTTKEPGAQIWEPLKINGETVKGAKVYIGAGDLANPQAPVPGTIYLDGVKLGEKVLDPAPNGPWKANQKAKTVVKDLLRSWLPCGLYVRYALEPEQVRGLCVGKAAAEQAKAAGVPVDPESVRSLFKIAP